MQNKLFKKSSMERFSSPEKLNDFIQVANPASWMVLGAALVLLAGVLVWGFFGELTESVSFTGIVRDGSLRCYVDSVTSSSLEAGMEVSIVPMTGGESGIIVGRVEEIADYPLSYAEASVGIEHDYLLSALNISTWNIVAEISAQEPLYEDVVYSVSAVTDVQRPVDLLLN